MFFCASSHAAVTLPPSAKDEILASASSRESIVLAGGCFWGIQAVYQHTKGVISATSGYSGGDAATANYHAIHGSDTGHAESVEVIYDPSKITLGQLLRIFFSVAHDPTELNRQGPDRGAEYRSAIFYTTREQQKIAQAYIGQLTEAKVFDEPIVTELAPMKGFYPAENYHQNFATLHPDNPYIVINDAPKVQNLKKEFPELYKD